jgi:rhodanese-related sulfurtransferase
MADIGRKMTEIAQSVVPSVPAKDVQERVKSGESFVILDVREPDEWANGVIESAVLLSRGRIEGRLEELVPDKDTAIVIH